MIHNCQSPSGKAPGWSHPQPTLRLCQFSADFLVFWPFPPFSLFAPWLLLKWENQRTGMKLLRWLLGPWTHVGSQKLDFTCFSQAFFFFFFLRTCRNSSCCISSDLLIHQLEVCLAWGGAPLCRSSVGRSSCSSGWPCSRNSALWFASTWKHLSGWSVTPRRKLSGANTESLIRNPINTELHVSRGTGLSGVELDIILLFPLNLWGSI